MDEAEVDRAGRMDERAEVLNKRAERKKVEADARYNAADAISEYIPRGQPILVWHYSERGHRRVLARMDGHMHKAVELKVGRLSGPLMVRPRRPGTWTVASRWDGSRAASNGWRPSDAGWVVTSTSAAARMSGAASDLVAVVDAGRGPELVGHVAAAG
ncbi:DUF3560 domain-containing protein [Pseudonocardia spinosispora]|uniref:DUF3560 domain-containing protein n=1 Tax=Pseudonocardia spinosispora TaxID=103441 RepID=UPI00146FA48E|nr:DUF3560 domain-containing protein [Pseudonocardia spinosispora]